MKRKGKPRAAGETLGIRVRAPRLDVVKAVCPAKHHPEERTMGHLVKGSCAVTDATFNPKTAGDLFEHYYRNPYGLAAWVAARAELNYIGEAWNFADSAPKGFEWTITLPPTGPGMLGCVQRCDDLKALFWLVQEYCGIPDPTRPNPILKPMRGGDHPKPVPLGKPKLMVKKRKVNVTPAKRGMKVKVRKR